MASAAPLRLAVLKKWRRSVLKDCGAVGVDAYVQDEYETLLKSLPILVYGLLKARIFKVNWYEVLGLELLAVVRRIGCPQWRRQGGEMGARTSATIPRRATTRAPPVHCLQPWHRANVR